VRLNQTKSTHTKKLPSLIVKKEKIMSKVEASKYKELRMQIITENQEKNKSFRVVQIGHHFQG